MVMGDYRATWGSIFHGDPVYLGIDVINHLPPFPQFSVYMSPNVHLSALYFGHPTCIITLHRSHGELSRLKIGSGRHEKEKRFSEPQIKGRNE